MLYHRILVPIDGSPGASKALRKAILLARDHDAEIAALSVEERPPRYAATVGEVEAEKQRQDAYFAWVQGEAVALAREQSVALKTEIVVGHAAESIVRYAREEAFDLIVIGQSGHSGVWGTLLGSTTDRVVEQAHCDVLVVR